MRTLFLTLITCLFVLPAQAKYSGGTGEPNDPYQIATAEDLMLLGNSPEDYAKHFILTADIDLDPNLPGRKVFDKAVIAPASYIGVSPWMEGTPFAGVFDGGGHTVSNLTIVGEDFAGLFGILKSGAQVTDVGLVDANITGSGSPVGGLVGGNDNSTVSRCYSNGAVTGSWCVGGLVGYNAQGFVTHCYSTGTVSGSDSGGLVGVNSGSYGRVNMSYSTASVRGDGRVGGLVGENGGLVTHCYSTGAVGGVSSAGGLVSFGSSGTVAQCFWDIQTSGQAESAGGMGKTTDEMQDIRTYLDGGWDFVGEIENGTHEVWQIPEGGGYPIIAALNGHTRPQLQGLGTAENSYVISNALELGAVADYSPNAHYRLGADIDLAGIRWAVPVIPWLAGTFDGNGHTVSNLTVTGVSYIGLFGQLTSGAMVKDLGVLDVNVSASGSYVGGLAGYNTGGTVTNCHASGSVTGTDWGVGGLVGDSYGGGLSNCHSSGTVTGGTNVGGLVGRTSGSNVVIADCYAVASVNGSRYVGGLVGYNSLASVARCYSTGMVGGDESVGGFAGANGGTISHSYSTGVVARTLPGGGFVGDNNPGIPGMAGRRLHGVVTACFWDTETSGQPTSAGGTGKTTVEMQTAKTFLDAGWDFVGETANGTEDLWWILEGKDYPRLWWETK